MMPSQHFSEYDDTLIFHLGAQAHVGESWDRPYETIDTNVSGTLNLLQSVVDLDLDITKFDTAGTSEEYGNVKEEMAEKHEFEEDGRVMLSERSPVNPTSIYATSKLAADFLTMNYNDAYGLPRLPPPDAPLGRVRTPAAVRGYHRRSNATSSSSGIFSHNGTA